MNQYITITKEIFPLDKEYAVSNIYRKSIFVPTFGKDNKGYYYLIDFKTRTITCWTIDNTEMRKKLRQEMHVDWNADAVYFYNNFLAAHAAQYYNNKIYIYSLSSNYTIVLNTEDDGYDVIIDEDAFSMVYSATNDIYNNELYYARWSLADMLKIFNDVYETIDIEVGKANLDTHQFTVFNSYRSGNTIHQTSVTPDGKRVVMLGMSTAPVGEFPNPTKEFQEKQNELKNVMDQGLLKSQISLYNSENNQISTLIMEAGTGHIEYDTKNDCCFISNHNLGYDAAQKNIYCFGEGQIDKVYIDDKINFIGTYRDSDFIRIPSHKVFSYNGKTLIAVSVYPNKVHFIDADSMTIYKKSFVMNNKIFTDFSNGPQIYPKIDRTPYTIHPIEGTPYIYLVNVWNVRLLNFLEDSVLETINYNFNKKALLTMGHALEF